MDHPITLTHQGGVNGNGINVSPPLTPTLQQQQQQSLDETRNLVSTATGRIQLLPMNSSIRPPTPAPSPQPRSRAQTRESITQVQQQLWTSTTINKQQQQQQQQEEEEELINRLRLEINQLPSNLRQQLLTLLINDSTPSNLSPLIHLITPRLKRDFLKTLPIELSFHVLSFVDEVKTLARASGVSRFWRALLQDETTWKRMCWKSGFGNAPLPPPPQPTLPPPTLLPTQTEDDSLSLGSLEEYSFGNNNNNGNERRRRNLIRNLEFGRLNEPISREDEFFTPAGRERRGTLDRTGLQEFAARAELFDLPPPPPPPLPRRGSTITTQQQRGSRDESDLAREREGSWSDAPPPVSTTTTSTEAEETSSTSNEMGLGFATSIITTSQPSSSSRSTTTSVSQRQQQESLPSLVSPPMFSLPSTSSPIPHNKPLRNSSSPPPPPPPTSTSTSSLKEIDPFSYKTHFKRAYLTESSWLRGPGRLLSTQMSADDGVVTSLGFDQEWIIVGMATSKIHVFESENGRYVRTLEGHELGVWCLTLVGKSSSSSTTSNTDDDDGNNRNRRDETEEEEESEFFSGHTRSNTSFDINSSNSRTTLPRRRRSSFPGGFTSTTTTSRNEETPPSLGGGGMGLGAGGRTGDSSQQSGVCSTARGWGQSGGARVISGGCDREVRVWKVETGECLHTLRGHTSTVRCMRVLNGRPLAVSGSRDSTLRVWDLEKGECLHLLSGHEHSVRCIEVSGNKVVSGSYDATCRLWDVDTGECLHVFRGHIHQIYAVAFDGIRVVTGSLDSTVRIWSAETGEFLALLQGHTSLVGQLILLPSSTNSRPTLVTGGSDGRVIVFDLESFDTVHRLCAHDNSVTCLQVDERFIVTGGNDGRIKLWDFKTGLLIRELIEPCGAVWRVVFRDDKCVTLCRREGKTLMDVRTFRPSEQELYG
ncbi:hypothetical protein JCM3765_000958 [Sporobolomyces pararoseus]